jgi:hypothetical protein
VGARDTSLAIYTIHPVAEEGMTKSEKYGKFPLTRRPITLVGHRNPLVAVAFDRVCNFFEGKMLTMSLNSGTVFLIFEG